MAEKYLNTDASGPEYFYVVISNLCQINAATVQNLVDYLKGLSLLKDPGKMSTFSVIA